MIKESALVYSTAIGEEVEIRDFAIIYENAVLENNVKVGEHSVIGRMPTPTSAVVRDLKMTNTITLIKKGVSICANVIVYGNVSIGENSLIGDNSSIMSDVRIGNEVLISRNVTINSSVEIGDNTRIMDNSHITGRVTIGKRVFISVGVTMANDNLFGRNGFSGEVQGAVIEDNVSIGVGSVIMPKVRIGNGSIVSAGSVVKDDVPEGVIVAGNPAKIVTRVPKYMKR
ncbi:MAG: transferase hexapeptide repeat containing protein [Bacilli bacterium]|nr:transferase hexapeptide repeat containing protein [Bacilli bacterium]